MKSQRVTCMWYSFALNVREIKTCVLPSYFPSSWLQEMSTHETRTMAEWWLQMKMELPYTTNSHPACSKTLGPTPQHIKKGLLILTWGFSLQPEYSSKTEASTKHRKAKVHIFAKSQVSNCMYPVSSSLLPTKPSQGSFHVAQLFLLLFLFCGRISPWAFLNDK